MKTYTIGSAVLGLSLFCGCTVEPTLTERNFGESVRQMIQAQTNDPSTLTNPSEETLDGSDGQRAEGVLETYRTDVYKPAPAGEPVVLSIEGGR
jgi:type IV pilus biogenesis protein CpaD/CtpE